MAINVQQLWEVLNQTVIAQPVPQLRGTSHLARNASAKTEDLEDPPSLLLDYSAAEFITYWLEKDFDQANQHVALNTLGKLSLLGPNVNDCMRLISEHDTVRATHQYLLNIVEPAAFEVVKHIGGLLKKELVLESRADVDLGRGKVNLAWSVHEKGASLEARDVLYLEFKKPNTLSLENWRGNCFNPDPRQPFGYEKWRDIKAKHEFPPEVKKHENFDMPPDHLHVIWRNEGSAGNIARQANTYFVRSHVYNGPRVPLIVTSDFRSVVMLDYNRTIGNSAKSEPMTTQADAREDTKRVGFCFLKESNPPAVMAQANNAVNVNLTFRLFLIAAIYAGTYEAMGWNFGQ